jgi:molecular chaperone GrpE
VEDSARGNPDAWGELQEAAEQASPGDREASAAGGTAAGRRGEELDDRQSAPEAGRDIPVAERGGGGGAPVDEAAGAEASGLETVPEADYLADLRRLQADFENYRKRMLREQTALAERANARLIERLLPVVDNFERVIAHGEGGPGVELVFKELKSVLTSEGLEEIPAEGEPFDPNVHEAVEATEATGIDGPVCTKVYRTGYRLRSKVLRPAMVAVSRPAEPKAEGGEEGPGRVDDEETPGAQAEGERVDEKAADEGRADGESGSAADQDAVEG